MRFVNNEVIISREEYYSLLRDSEILARLEAGGVDNWTWYSESIWGPDNDESMADWEDRNKRELGLE